jgi:hypothetical protein
VPDHGVANPWRSLPLAAREGLSCSTYLNNLLAAYVMETQRETSGIKKPPRLAVAGTRFLHV